MEYVYNGAAIECSNADIISKKIEPGSIISVPNVGVCRKYTCTRNSEAFIIKELRDKKKKVNPKAHVDLNDSLRAENIVVFVKSTKTLSKEKCPYTGRHNTQYMSAPYFTQAEITRQFHNVKSLVDTKQIAAAPLKIEADNKK
jgi:hypothetical protein